MFGPWPARHGVDMGSLRPDRVAHLSRLAVGLRCCGADGGQRQTPPGKQRDQPDAPFSRDQRAGNSVKTYPLSARFAWQVWHSARLSNLLAFSSGPTNSA